EPAHDLERNIAIGSSDFPVVVARAYQSIEASARRACRQHSNSRAVIAVPAGRGRLLTGSHIVTSLLVIPYHFGFRVEQAATVDCDAARVVFQQFHLDHSSPPERIDRFELLGRAIRAERSGIAVDAQGCVAVMP